MRPFSTVILDCKLGDVTGDGIIDKVYLTGNYPYDSPFVENITLVIENGQTDVVNRIPLRANAGYNPTIFLGDFTGDKILDILIRIDSGGSGAIEFAYLFSFFNSNLKVLFDSEEFYEEFQYDVIYLDYYKVDVISKRLNKVYTLDITYKGQDYLSEIYNENGKLIKPIEGWVDPISGLYPIDLERDGIYELLAWQQIAGRYHADSLGYVETTLKWNNTKLQPFFQYVAIPGSDL